MSVKLTGSEIRFLINTMRHGRMHASNAYPDVIRLISLGLIQNDAEDVMGFHAWFITDSGRAWLERAHVEKLI